MRGQRCSEQTLPSRSRGINTLFGIQRSMTRVLLYVVAINLAMLFVFPLLSMLSLALQSVTDLVDPTVNWIPTAWYPQNITTAFTGLRYLSGLKNTGIICILSAIGQVVTCSMAGYAFGRFMLPGRDVLFAVVMLSFLVPPQTIIVPLFILFQRLGWIDTPLPFVVPSFFAHGLRGPLFVLIFSQFFRRLPSDLNDAAEIDGASPLRVFWQIMLPLAKPAIIVVLLFSVVWHWNDYFEPRMFLLSSGGFTLSLRLAGFQQSLAEVYMGSAPPETQPLRMAASLLVILPPLLLYAVAQKHFVESIERTGIVG